MSTRFWSQKGIGLNTVSPQIKKKWSWNNSDAKVLNIPLPMSGKQVDVLSKKQQSSERCWSLVGCASAATMGLKKLHSFS